MSWRPHRVHMERLPAHHRNAVVPHHRLSGAHLVIHPAALPGMKSHVTAALPRARAAQIRVITRNPNRNASEIETLSRSRVPGSRLSGTWMAASLTLFS